MIVRPKLQAVQSNESLCPRRLLSTMKRDHVLPAYAESKYDPSYAPYENMTGYQALIQFTRRKDELVQSMHPRDEVELAVTRSVATISPGAIVSRTSEATETLTFHSGFYMKNEKTTSPAVKLIRAQVSDQLAYLYTPLNSSELASATLPMTNQTKCNLVKAPYHEPAMLCPNTFVLKNSVANARGFYEDSLSSAGFCQAMQYGVTIQREMKKAFEGSCPTIAENFKYRHMPISKDKFTSDLLQSDGSVKSVYTLLACTRPPIPKITKMDTFWSHLHIHRELRGEDGGGVSPMTSGYYMGTMTRAADELLWNVTDVMDALKLLRVGSVYYSDPSQVSAAVYQSLKHNLVTVMLLTANIEATTIKAASVNNVPKAPLEPILSYVSHRRLARPYITKRQVMYAGYDTGKGMLESIVKIHALHSGAKKNGDLTVVKNENVTIMTHVYISPALSEMYSHVSVLYSMHAHAAHVIVLYPPVKGHVNPTLEDVINRAAVANSFKTWFPISRRRFYEHDMANFRHETVISGTIVLASSMITIVEIAKFEFEEYGPEDQLQQIIELVEMPDDSSNDPVDNLMLVDRIPKVNNRVAFSDMRDHQTAKRKEIKKKVLSPPEVAPKKEQKKDPPVDEGGDVDYRAMADDSEFT